MQCSTLFAFLQLSNFIVGFNSVEVVFSPVINSYYKVSCSLFIHVFFIFYFNYCFFIIAKFIQLRLCVSQRHSRQVGDATLIQVSSLNRILVTQSIGAFLSVSSWRRTVTPLRFQFLCGDIYFGSSWRRTVPPLLSQISAVG